MQGAKINDHIYDANGTACHGYLARPASDAPAVGILVVPVFSGLSDKERKVCDDLAAAGYVALGVDYYGRSYLAASREAAMAQMAGLQADRATLAARMRAALDAMAALPCVAKGRIGAPGYCFGGKAVLDLARRGAGFRAGVTMHGVYDPPRTGSVAMRADMLICHGWDDPLCPPDATVGLAAELTTHCPDWQMLAFGHTSHAFTAPAANSTGADYNKAADGHSWQAMMQFFSEKLS